MSPSAPNFEAQCALAFPGQSNAVESFFKEIEAVYRDLYADVAATGGVPVPPTSIGSLLGWPSQHPHAWKWINRPFMAMLDHFFKDRQLKDLLSTISEYITDQAGLLSVGDMAPLYGYYFDGGFYPAGGSQRLADLLSEIIVENGKSVRLGTKASRLLMGQRHGLTGSLWQRDQRNVPRSSLQTATS